MKLLISTLCLFWAGPIPSSSTTLQELEYRNSFVQPTHHHHHNSSAEFPTRRSYYESRNNQFLASPTGQEHYRINPALHNRERSSRNYQNGNGSDMNGSGNKKQKVFRTYGRGKAQVSRKGESVVVPNALGRGNDRVEKEEKKPEQKQMKEQEQKQCTGCPEDHTVVATKGNNFVILPEPCPSNTWNPMAGPRPGSKIQEGIHIVEGVFIPHNQYCRYQYQVLVHRCKPLKANEEDTKIQCTESNVWGSKCTIVCGPNKEAQGPSVLECMDDQTWSNPVPTCKSKMDCSMPKVKSNSKVYCETANMEQVQGDFIPNGSTCRFNKNGKKVSITCKDGTWRVSRKPKKNIVKPKSKPEKIPDVCKPNPCQNGGMCFRSESNKEQPLCVCRPPTQGLKCEITPCDYSFCENGGMCFKKNGTDTCYCHPDYFGDRCQFYTYS